MKTVPQITFTGLKGTSLTLTEDGKASPLTSLALFRIAALRGPGQASRAEVTTLIWRKCIKAFDAIEAAEAAKAGEVELEDDWYALLRPIVDSFALQSYGINSPFIEDALEAAIEGANKDAGGKR